MRNAKSWFFASLLAASACAPGMDPVSGQDDDYEVDGGADVEADFLGQSSAALCPVGRPCGGGDPGDGDIDPIPQPTIALAYAPTTKRVTINLTNMPNGAVAIARQTTIDWTCTMSPNPGVRTAIGNVTVQNGSASFTDTNVPDDARVFYFAVYRNQNGVSQELRDSVDTKIVQPRGTKFELTGADKHNVYFHWVDEYMTEDTFIVQRKSGSSWTEVTRRAGDFNVSCQSYDGSEHVQPSTRYCYRLRVHSALGDGYSPEKCITTQALERPSKPSNLSCGPSTNESISFSWDYNGSIPITGFYVKNMLASGQYDTVGADVHEWSYGGLSPNGNWKVRVHAINEDGDGPDAEVWCQTSGQTPSQCPGGGNLNSFTFCQVCDSQVSPRVTTTITACSKDDAKAIAQSNAVNCQIEDGPC
jgi:hypothetical protein